MSPPSTGPLSRLRDYRTVRRSSGIGHYPRPDAVEVCAQAWGVKFSTARQRMNPAAPECVWVLAGQGTAALVRAGLIERSESLNAIIDGARLLPPQLVDLAAVRAAIMAEQAPDGAEDDAQVALIDWSDAALDTWLRRAEKHMAVQGAAVRITRAFLGRARC